MAIAHTPNHLEHQPSIPTLIFTQRKSIFTAFVRPNYLTIIINTTYKKYGYNYEMNLELSRGDSRIAPTVAKLFKNHKLNKQNFFTIKKIILLNKSENCSQKLITYK